ncbi:MAG TPA: hypothetical protein VFR58_11005 [Flavisolibacter sp.]|nr:hypothetical protein [Flavisolibacter sp.]
MIRIYLFLSLLVSFTVNAQPPLQTSSKVVVDDTYNYTELSVTPWGGSHGIFFGAKMNYSGSGNLWDLNNVVHARDAGIHGFGAFSLGYLANGGAFNFYDGGLSTGTGNPVGWTPVMTLLRGGKIGMGNSSPAYKLHVNGTVAFNNVESNTVDLSNATAAGNHYLAITNNNYFGIRQGTNHSLNIDSYNAGSFRTALTVLQSGDIGIGVPNPQAKLAVNGDIHSRKVRVTQTGWPDYVFSPSYKLLSLREVEEFIKKNGHLPEIEPACQVEQQGLDLGDNQAALLKKIEELTLYIIEQDKQLKSQKEEIDQIKELLKKVASSR